MTKWTRSGSRPIARRIALLLVIPLVSLMGLWGFATATSLQEALEKRQFSTVYDAIGVPVTMLSGQLQIERAAAAAYLGRPSAAGEQQYQAQATRTDAAITSLRTAVNSEEVRESSQQPVEMGNMTQEFAGLDGTRRRVLERGTAPLAAIEEYNRVSDRVFHLLTEFASEDDVEVYRQIQALLNSSWAREFMLREDALLAAAPPDGRLSPAHRSAFTQWAGSRRQLYDMARSQARGDFKAPSDQLAAAPAFVRYVELETAVVQAGAAGEPLPDLAEWRTTTQALSQLWAQNGMQAGAIADRKVQEVSDRIMLRLYLTGGVGFLVVLLSVAICLRFARGISGELRRLQRAAQELAQVRLPRVVARLRRGEDVDVQAEAPHLGGGKTREIVSVAAAFADVQRTAVDVAVAEAELRGNINQVFVNLSWRSQNLLQRQLRLLDAMEHRASSSEELDDLFKLDHLTTRMRRHAEGLVILSGAPTVRAWDQPVPAEDVVRAALAEIEDYQRVEIVATAPVAVVGDAVGDVIHLLAELIENAAVFSPPTNEVGVRLDSVANGLVVEVIDRGIGMLPEQREEINRRLAEPPDFDLADSDRLGLFVVARLAARHGIGVQLHPSPYGGTTAIVLIPRALVLAEESVRQSPVPAGAVRPAARPAPIAHTFAPALSAWEAPDPEPAAPVASPAPAPVPGRRGAPLPRRVRQENLAPELRRRPRHAREDEPVADDGFAEPDPETSRDLMSSLQSGWSLGREDDEGTDPPQGRGEA